MLEGIISQRFLPMIRDARPFWQQLTRTVAPGLAAVTGEHYEGGHWLGSFAVYLTTQQRNSTQSGPHPP